MRNPRKQTGAVGAAPVPPTLMTPESDPCKELVGFHNELSQTRVWEVDGQLQTSELVRGG